MYNMIIDQNQIKTMKLVFLNECAADGCYKKNIGNGYQMCKEHQSMYDNGISFRGFGGKKVLKRQYQNNLKK